MLSETVIMMQNTAVILGSVMAANTVNTGVLKNYFSPCGLEKFVNCAFVD